MSHNVFPITRKDLRLMTIDELLVETIVASQIGLDARRSEARDYARSRLSELRQEAMRRDASSAEPRVVYVSDRDLGAKLKHARRRSRRSS